MPNKELLIKFAQLKIKEKQIADELNMIKDQCLNEIESIKGESEQAVELSELPGYKFSVMKKKTWTYSEFVQNSEKALKERKKEEEKSGDATFEEKGYLLFIHPKD